MQADSIKKHQLKRHKAFATGLFVLMLLLYMIAVVLEYRYHIEHVGYLEAFSEAAMVGALADWFAVTALFHYPLGIRIPHTNIIQRSKDKIGANLGSFVVDNFLNAHAIKPYFLKLEVVRPLTNWILKEQHLQLISLEIKKLVKELLAGINEQAAQNTISVQLKNVVQGVDLSNGLSDAIRYFANAPEMTLAINTFLDKAIEGVQNNQHLVKQKVKENSYFFIPGFVDNKVAEKISNGIIAYLNEVKSDEEHPTRQEIRHKILELAHQIQSEGKWQNEINQLKETLIQSQKLDIYALEIWNYLQKTAEVYLDDEHNQFETKAVQYISKTIKKLQGNVLQVQAIDKWIRSKAYYYTLKNTARIGDLITQTIAVWDGRELSEKLELEVGKDLQFIRINGTLVGGLVGVLIYTITQMLLPYLTAL